MDDNTTIENPIDLERGRLWIAGEWWLLSDGALEILSRNSGRPIGALQLTNSIRYGHLGYIEFGRINLYSSVDLETLIIRKRSAGPRGQRRDHDRASVSLSDNGPIDLEHGRLWIGGQWWLLADGALAIAAANSGHSVRAAQLNNAVRVGVLRAKKLGRINLYSSIDLADLDIDHLPRRQAGPKKKDEREVSAGALRVRALRERRRAARLAPGSSAGGETIGGEDQDQAAQS